MATNVPRNEDAVATIASANLVQFVPGDLVKIVWIRPSSAANIVISQTLNEGDALPAGRGWPVAAGEGWPVTVYPGYKILVSVTSGAGTVAAFGEQ